MVALRCWLHVVFGCVRAIRGALPQSALMRAVDCADALDPDLQPAPRSGSSKPGRERASHGNMSYCYNRWVTTGRSPSTFTLRQSLDGKTPGRS